MQKRSGEIKIRRNANGIFQSAHTNKNNSFSSTLKCFALKHVCKIIAKEEQCAAAVDLLGFFLQTEIE